MELIRELDDDDVELVIDLDKIVRVFENLLSNAIKLYNFSNKEY